MTSVSLDRLWIHRADDFATYLKFFTTASGDERDLDGRVNATASGRLRIITSTSRRKQHPTTLRQVTDDALATLEDWLGDLLMIRDQRGRLMFATYVRMAVTDYKDRSGFDVAVTFLEATSSIEV